MARVRPDVNGYYSDVIRKPVQSPSGDRLPSITDGDDSLRVSEQVRGVLQGGIQTVMESLRTASTYNKEDLNTLMQFYRSMYSMSIHAAKLETRLKDVINGNATRSSDRLSREFGVGRETRLLETVAEEETPGLCDSGGNADSAGYGETPRESDPIGESGTPRLVLNFVRSETSNVVRQSE